VTKQSSSATSIAAACDSFAVFAALSGEVWVS
jgi:hypothetical protein